MTIASVAYPDFAQPLVDKFHQEASVRTQIRQRLAGKSGAFVALVDCEGRHDGVYVVKIGTNPRGYDSEEVRHGQALAVKAFHGKVPAIVARANNDDHYLLLLKIAGGSRLQWKPLVESLRLVRSAYQQLADALWDPSLAQYGAQEDLSRIVPSTLDYQLQDSAGGRILKHVTTVFGPELRTASVFAHFGEVLPNPVAFALDGTKFAAQPLRPLLAPFHGDCHAGNVFVRIAPDAAVADVALIDLASYRSQAPFGFDPAYFALATLLHQMDSLGEIRWKELTRALASGDNGEIEKLEQTERAWAVDLNAGVQKVIANVEGSFPDRADDFKLQFLLAHVAAGLSFLNKVPRESSGSIGLTPGQYRQAFLWSAVFLAEFLRLCGRSQYPAERRISEISQIEAAPVSLTDEQWHSVEEFDGKGLNILLLSSEVRSSQQAELLALLRLPWNLIVDFGTAPLAPELEGVFRRSVRQWWPGAEAPELKILTRGSLWYFANGRADLSDTPPTEDSRSWRQKYHRPLQDLMSEISTKVAPNSARALVVGDQFDPTLVRIAAESIDTAFGPALRPIIVASTPENVALLDVPILQARLGAVLDKIAAFSEPRAFGAPELAVMPCRVAETIRLESIPADLAVRVEKDLTLVYRHRASQLPIGRVFGEDFRRGMRIEWAELEQGLDVERAPFFGRVRQSILEALAALGNATVNVMHEPSAGGTTLSRRLAWSLMEEYPVILVDQLSEDTPSYLRDVFQWSGLPLVVVMEAGVVSQSARERLLEQLREDNTRAVLIWVSRAYGDTRRESVLQSRLSPQEARAFLEAYRDYVDDPEKRALVERLASDPTYSEQRSPFFFGLAAFGERFVGLDRLVEDTLRPLSIEARLLVGDLALASAYSSEGLPAEEFDELCAIVNRRRRPFDERSPFALVSDGYVRNPHRLIAQRTLMALAREPQEWRADLALYTNTFLDHISELRNTNSERLQRTLQTMFITRDTASTLATDTDAEMGGIAQQRRFAPLIYDVGSIEQARRILARLTEKFPLEPHYAVHYARHLIYEDPKDISRAISVSSDAASIAEGLKDDAVVHVVGMCYRARMFARLEEARARHVPFSNIMDAVLQDFQTAVDHFARAIELSDSSEYGHVSLVQMVSRLLRTGMQLTHSSTLGDFARVPGRRWCLEALSLAEQHIAILRERPHRTLSKRAERTIAEWHLVYGHIGKTIERLKALLYRYEDSEIRRAVCNAILAQHNRRWSQVSETELITMETLLRRNIESQGARDEDVLNWFRAFRHSSSFDMELAIERLVDWRQLRPQLIDPVFYLYVLYFLRWLNTDGVIRGYGLESTRWLELCRRMRRATGSRTWSYEWLVRDRDVLRIEHFTELTYNPVDILRGTAPEYEKRMRRQLARVVGTLIRFDGPQNGVLDVGHSLRIRFTPRDRIVKDDLGKRISVYVSFSYDAPVGWDPVLKD